MLSTGLNIEDLSVTFQLPSQTVRAVDGVTVQFPAGRITGLIGESGCGKSVLGMAALGLLPPYAHVSGSFSLDGEALTERGAREKLGTVIGFIPQNPSESLNPARTVHAHLKEALLPLHLKGKSRRHRAEELLTAFGFSEPARILPAYPHELSGGMQQRVLCAIGTACSPRWILADEPTKGLDRHLREQVQDTLLSLRKQGVESMIVITHDLPLAHALCDDLAVMYAGQIVEQGTCVLTRPLHPYTQAFLDALPENGFQPMHGIAPRVGERLLGCPFAPRCPKCSARCLKQLPPATVTEDGRMVRCYLYE